MAKTIIDDVRTEYPEYGEMSDIELAGMIYNSSAQDVDFEDYAMKLGVKEEDINFEKTAQRLADAQGIPLEDARGKIREKDRSGFIGAAKNLAEGVYFAFGDTLPEQFFRAIRGGDITPETKDSYASQQIARQQKEAAQHVPSLQEAQAGKPSDFFAAPTGVVSSAATGLAGAAVGGATGAKIGALIGGPAGAATGGTLGMMAGSAGLTYPSIYNAAKDQFIEEVQNSVVQKMGRDLTQEEAERLNTAIEADAKRFGTAEAGFEAIGNAISAGIFGGATGAALKSLGFGGKTLGALAEKVAGKPILKTSAQFTGGAAGEIATELPTYHVEEDIRQLYGLRDTAPTTKEFMEEQAGQVVIGSVLMGGASRLAGKLAGADKLEAPKKQKQDDIIELTDIVEAGTADFEQAGAGTPSWQPGEPSLEEQWNVEAERRGIAGYGETPKQKASDNMIAGMNAILDNPKQKDESVIELTDIVETGTADFERAGAGQTEWQAEEPDLATQWAVEAERKGMSGYGESPIAAAMPQQGVENARQPFTGTGGNQQTYTAENIEGTYPQKVFTGTGSIEQQQARQSQKAPQKPRISGAPVKVKVPNREDIDATYELVELEDVQASHKPLSGFQRNQNYQLENERQYHKEPASREKVVRNAAELDPAFLIESVDANHGAPVVDDQGNVLGGNGRAMSIERAYAKNKQGAERYKQALREKAVQLGLDPATVDTMKAPMLIRRTGISGEASQGLVSALNEDFKDTRERRAAGKSRGDRFTKKTLNIIAGGLKDFDTLRGYFNDETSRSAIDSMVEDGVIAQTDMNAILGSDRLLNPDGKKIIEESLRGRIAKNYDSLSKIDTLSLGKIDGAMPHVLISELVGGKWNITQHMSDAIDLLAEFRTSSEKKHNIFLKQTNMMFDNKTPEERYSPQAILIFKMLLENKKQDFVNAFRQYAANAKISDEAGGLGVGKTQEQAFDEYIKPKEAEIAQPVQAPVQEQAQQEELEDEAEPEQQYDEEATELSSDDMPLDDSFEEEQAPTPQPVTEPEPQAVEQDVQPQEQPAQEVQKTEDTGIDYGVEDDLNVDAISDYFAEKLLNGARYQNIGEARKQFLLLTKIPVKAGTPLVKKVDEVIELGVVKASRKIIEDIRKRNGTDLEIFEALVDLYKRQPVLGSRTSTSITEQAYSTPAPIAFIASKLAGITQDTTVYEPSAGNGMLLIEANKSKTQANELNADRAKNLKLQGFAVTKNDATKNDIASDVDVVIANPPFGRAIDNETKEQKSWTEDGFTTSEIDQAIAVKAIGNIHENGRAVLIIGGKQGNRQDRSDKYNTASQRKFYNYLFKNYNVTDHISIAGNLYSRQGASYPIDIIVINGKGKTENAVFPAANVPRIYDTFTSLKELVDGKRAEITRTMDTARDSAPSADTAEVGQDRQGTADTGTGSGKPSVSDTAKPDVRGDVVPERIRDTRTDRPVRGPSEATTGRPADVIRPSDDNRRTGTDEQSDRAAETTEDGERNGRTEAELRGADARRLGNGSDNKATSLDTQLQKAYAPKSNATSMGTLVPNNMAMPVQDALQKVVDTHGEIDAYVASKLGYKTEELGNYFAAEQIDAIALAIDNIDNNAGFIIGDQTGIGKGRVNAAIIKYAKRIGKIPVFITMKPELYADMVRDIEDIGVTSFKPLITNSEQDIPLQNGGSIKTGSSSSQRKILADAAKGDNIKKYDAVFTTYAQLNSRGKGRELPRRDFITSIARSAVFILDESHNAGGGGAKRTSADAPVPTSTFIRNTLNESPNGTFYSSATYAKRPDVMSLYSKTDIRFAVQDMAKLAEAIEAGGIPLQQVVAAQLAEAGQYIRRERSFEGATVDVVVTKSDFKKAEEFSEIVRAINSFDMVKNDAVKKKNDSIKSTGDVMTNVRSVGEGAMATTAFSSIMHNIINQSLLAMKAKAAADEAVAAIRNNEKPVITVANTLGKFIEDYAKDQDIKNGEPINVSFQSLLMRYLEKSREVSVVDAGGEKVYQRLTDSDLGPTALSLYNAAKTLIENSSFDEIPISPIDAIEAGIREAGYSVGEITGRSSTIDYAKDGSGTYATRAVSAKKNIETMKAFNSGKLDAIVLNQSGSTGISLHSSEKFEDQRKRTMIIAQAELNIDVFMQMLGRVFRTGQVTPPAYKLLTSELPAEKRPAAILGKKMASLNANTTASRKTDTSFKNIPDFMNEYGDTVAAQLMAEEPEIHAALGFPLSYNKDKEEYSTENAIAKVTGRLPMLPVVKQKEVYEKIEAMYNFLLEQVELSGSSVLEAKTLDLDAIQLEVQELTPAQSVGKASPFAEASYVGEFSIKQTGKPYSSKEVREKVASGKELVAKEKYFPKETKERADEYQKKLEDSFKTPEAKQNFIQKMKDNTRKVIDAIQELNIGRPVHVSTKETSFDGIVTSRQFKGKGSPVAPSSWQITIAIVDAGKQITIPVSKLKYSTEGLQAGDVAVQNGLFDEEKTYAMFDEGQVQRREKRAIAFGNILAAYAAIDNKGAIINFKDHNGKIRSGIMYSKGMQVDTIVNGADIEFTSTEQIDAFFEKAGANSIVVTSDNVMKIQKLQSDKYVITVKKSKADGGKYFQNPDIIRIVGDFVKVSDGMRVRVGKERLGMLLNEIRSQGNSFEAGSHYKEAREVLGLTKKGPAGEKPTASLASAKVKPSGNIQKKAKSISVVAKKLASVTKASAETEVVETFADLPQNVQEAYADESSRLEAVYNPTDGKIYMVAENITTENRAVEVWIHEQVVHHGLRSMMTPNERKQAMTQLWKAVGGMKNKDVKALAESYGLNPLTSMSDRIMLMEEYLASLAEKRSANILNDREKLIWKRFVLFVKALLNKVARAVGSKELFSVNAVDALLTDLSYQVFRGDARMFRTPIGTVPQASFIGEQGAISLDAEQGVDTRAKNLKLAIYLEEHKYKKRDIKILTGWERGAEGKWRYEISDLEASVEKGVATYLEPYTNKVDDAIKEYENILSQLELATKFNDFDKNKYKSKEEAKNDLTKQLETANSRVEYYREERIRAFNDGSIPLRFMVSDELMSAYPELENMEVDLADNLESDVLGYYDKRRNAVVISSRTSLEEQRSTLVHEVQHAIQQIEGFAQGGDPSMFTEKQVISEKAKNMLDEINSVLGKEKESSVKTVIEILKKPNLMMSMIGKVNKVKQVVYKNGFENLEDAAKFLKRESSRGTKLGQYLALAGEVEARNVQKRINFTDEEREESLASSTETIPRTEQIFMYDNNVMGSIREKPAPKKTVKAYKLFRVKKTKKGQIFPLFVKATDPVEIGVWLDAEIGEQTNKGKVKSTLGDLAFRPGWHAGDSPMATHIGKKSDKSLKAPDLRPENQVWAEVELAADVDWQTQATKNGYNDKGVFVPNQAHITTGIPVDGFYRYKTNANMTGEWLIGGAMKVTRLLTDEEVAKINNEHGVSDLTRVKPFDFEEYGFNKEEDAMASLASKRLSGISEQEIADNPDLASALGKIGAEKPTIKQKIEALRENWKRRVEQGVFDQFASIKDVSQRGYRLARMTTSLGSQLSAMIQYGAPVWRGDVMGVEGKSLMDVFSPVNGELDRYLRWAIGVRSSRLIEEGREHLFTEKEINAMLGLAKGKMPDGKNRADEYRKVFKDFAVYKRKVLDFAEDAGLVTKESRSVWENDDYIPFYRVAENLSGIKGGKPKNALTGQTSQIKRLKGGEENLGDPLENIFNNFSHLIDASQKNKAAAVILTDMEQSGAAVRLTKEEAEQQFEAVGRELQAAVDEELGDVKAFGSFTAKQKREFLSALSPQHGFNFVTIDGKPVWFTINDELLYRAMNNMRQDVGRQGMAWSIMRKAKRLLTSTVTVMPDFILRNFARDTVSIAIQEHNSKFTPFVDSLKAAKDVLNPSDDMKQLIASGGAFEGSGYRLGTSNEEAAKVLKKLLKQSGKNADEFNNSILDTPKKLASFVGKVFGYYEKVQSASENASRLAVYKKLKAKGFSDDEAAYMAKDLMDFTMRGEWAAIRALTDIVPFLGARLAGLNRLGRGATENKRAFAAKGLMLTTASIALYAANMMLHPDDYDDLEDWEKDIYYHFFIGGEHYRLPKPFEVGLIFGTIPERIMEQLMTDAQGTKLADRVFVGAMDTLSFDPIPQLVKPLYEQAINKSTFTGRPIVSMGMQYKVPVDQYRAYTSETAKGIARMFDAVLTPIAGKTGYDYLRSPVRIESLVRGYTGSLGTTVLGIADTFMGAATNAPETPSKRLEEYPILKVFYRGDMDAPKRTRYESELYNVLRDADKLASSLREVRKEGGNVSEARAELNDEDLLKLAFRKGLNSVSRELTKLNKAAERIRKSRALTSDEKRKRLDVIQKRKNVMTKNIMKRMEAAR